MNEVITYIYTLSDPITSNVRYIGKSNDPINRLKVHIRNCNRYATYKSFWIRSLLTENLEPELDIIDEVDKSEWKYWEAFWINQFKAWGFRLTNATNGGDGGDTFSNMTDRQKEANILKKQKIANKHSIFNTYNTIYDYHVEKYGRDIADQKRIAQYDKASKTKQRKFETRLRKIETRYKSEIIKLYPNSTVIEIINKYKGKVPRNIIRKYLQDEYGNLLGPRKEMVTGTQNVNAKLTCNEVALIKDEYNTNEVTYKELSRKYKVSQSQIGSIINGNSYKNCI